MANSPVTVDAPTQMGVEIESVPAVPSTIVATAAITATKRVHSITTPLAQARPDERALAHALLLQDGKFFGDGFQDGLLRTDHFGGGVGLAASEVERLVLQFLKSVLCFGDLDRRSCLRVGPIFLAPLTLGDGVAEGLDIDSVLGLLRFESPQVLHGRHLERRELDGGCRCILQLPHRVAQHG